MCSDILVSIAGQKQYCVLVSFGLFGWLLPFFTDYVSWALVLSIKVSIKSY